MDKKDDKFLIALKDIIRTFVIYFVVLFLVTTFLARPIRVEGSSMVPTLHDGELGFSNIFSVKIGDINRFDIVIVYIEQTDKYIVKRVIGMPGDTISFENDILYINGVETAQPFLDTDYVNSYKASNNDSVFTHDVNPVTLGSEEYFLMGDNRPYSTDSRVYGPFHKSEIKSKDALIIYPLNKIRFEGR